MTSGSLPISVYMITKDNIRTVEKALQSVVDWADEIVVVDSGSTDGTVETLKKYTDRVSHRDWPGFRDQYQHAQDLTKNQWVLFIDADEEIGPDLAGEIADLFTGGEPEADGYIAHRRTYYLGRLIKYGGWYPDFEIRLYRKDTGGWKGGLHAKVHVDGEVRELEHVYLHYNYRDIADQIRTVNLYSDIEAEEKDKANKEPSLFKMLLSPPFRFFRDYVLKRGFLDGIPGLIIAVTTSYYIFAKYAKLWERRRVMKSEGKGS